MMREPLPDDVVLDILLRLPVKSLKRFKSVCRSWCYNFEDPDFVREHYRTNSIRGTNLHTIVKSTNFIGEFGLGATLSHGETSESCVVNNWSLLLNETMRVRETINIPIPPVVFPEMVSECEGLILFSGSVDPYPVLLLNPATRELKTLPQSSFEGPDYTKSIYHLRAYGLGYDCCTSDYKVVRFVDCYGCTPQTELYTLSSNSWRLIPNYEGWCFEHFRDTIRFNIYLNGHSHWWLNEGYDILAFDMTQETFHVMQFSSWSDFSICCSGQLPELKVFNNYLAVFLHSEEKMGCFEIWAMKEYGVMGSWTKQLVIGPILGVGEWRGGIRNQLLGMWKTGEWFYKTDEGRLALYHPHTKAIKDLEIFTCAVEFALGLRLYIFTESLFSLNGG